MTARPSFEAFKARVLANPAIRAAYEARRADATYGLDKRQARRLRRRLNLKGADRD